ncbi:bifunctional riboflavin kinase/FAD synthetase [Corynebacterium alimapuense]|uniref:Riboflavin biosynthesis protein n=1 Tax=Corynebacterium alimapuense TaxID=1576874 RepID=A0A3M8K817_9CORY|nr:bifunctional riboflavin kinase/FAD synthetase [Corynebacterium alimapuense]RNE49371.1 bifunctional riboflavin kinase/FAD synthetase [Corynebacterium alimapuense]
MIVWHGIEEVPADLKASVVTIGVFDGVHRGHGTLLAEAVSQAREREVPSVLVTFDPHPMAVFAPEWAPLLLTSLEQRLELAGEMGIDAVLVVDFNHELAGLEPISYFASLVTGSLRARAVVVGENFTFGRDASGTAETMRELGAKYGVKVTVLDLFHDEGVRICSSSIRQFLSGNDVERAAWALGRPFTVRGQVVRGAGRGGRELGYPTANQYFGDRVAIPADGVYAGWFTVRGQESLDGDMEPGIAYPAAISVGTNPTFGDTRRSVESFVLDHTADLYDRVADVSFVGHVRDMVKFNSVDELLGAIHRDVETVRRILKID